MGSREWGVTANECEFSQIRCGDSLHNSVNITTTKKSNCTLKNSELYGM